MYLKILPFVLGTCVSSGLFAQAGQDQPAKPNNYTFRLYNAESHIKEATDLLTRLTAASAVNYNVADSTFAVTTLRELDPKIISGKLQKNFYPVKSMSKAEHSFPKFTDTGNPEQDARDYESRKAKWINENPDEYKAMLDTPSQK